MPINQEDLDMNKPADLDKELDIDTQVNLDNELDDDTQANNADKSFFQKLKTNAKRTYESSKNKFDGAIKSSKNKLDGAIKSSKNKINVATETKDRNSEQQFLESINALTNEYKEKNFSGLLNILEKIFNEKNGIIDQLKNSILRNDEEFQEKVLNPMLDAYKKFKISLTSVIAMESSNNNDLKEYEDEINKFIKTISTELPKLKKLNDEQKVKLEEILQKQNELQKFSESTNFLAAGASVASLKLDTPFFSVMSSFLWLASAIPAHLNNTYSDISNDSKKEVINQIYEESKDLYNKINQYSSDAINKYKEAQESLQKFCYKLKIICKKYGKDYLIYRKVKHAFFNFISNMVVPQIDGFQSNLKEEISLLDGVIKGISKKYKLIKNKFSILTEKSDTEKESKIIKIITDLENDSLNPDSNKITLSPGLLKRMFGKGGILRTLTEKNGILENDEEFKNKICDPILNKYRKLKIESLKINLENIDKNQYSDILQKFEDMLAKLQQELVSVKKLSPQQKYMLEQINITRNKLTDISNGLNTIGAASGIISLASGPLGAIAGAASAISWCASSIPSLASKVYDSMEENIYKDHKNQKNKIYEEMYKEIKNITKELNQELTKDGQSKITKIVEDTNILKHFAEQCQVYCENYGTPILYRNVKKAFFSIIEKFDTDPIQMDNFATHTFKTIKNVVLEKASKASLILENVNEEQMKKITEKINFLKNNEKNGHIYVNSQILKQVFGKGGLLRALVEGCKTTEQNNNQSNTGILKNDKEFIKKVYDPILQQYKNLKLESKIEKLISNSNKELFENIQNDLNNIMSELNTVKLSPKEKNQLKKIKKKQRELSILGDLGNLVGGGSSVAEMAVIPYNYVSAISWFISSLTAIASRVYNNMSVKINANIQKKIEGIYGKLKDITRTFDKKQKEELKNLKILRVCTFLSYNVKGYVNNMERLLYTEK